MHYVQAKGILSAGNGMNLYRGCQHGCIYCDSRSKCYQMDHAFEDIEVKENAISLLEAALKRKRRPCMIGMGSMTDPYIPLEETLRHTREALELVAKYGFGATLITKSARVLRDLDVLTEINSRTKAVVQMTMTTFDEGLCRILEPNVSTTRERFEALKVLRDAGIPTVVWLCPILPFLNDTEENLRGILDCCAEAEVRGVICFGMGLTLREGNREYFYRQLDRHFPGLKERYIRTYGNAYELPSPNNPELMQLFHRTCEEAGMLHDNARIFQYLRQWEEKQQQMSLLIENDAIGGIAMTADELQFFEKMPQFLPIYVALREKLEERYRDFGVKVTKTQISLRNRHVFAMASLPFRRLKGWPKEYLLVSFGLNYQNLSPRIAQSVEPYPGRWTHHVVVTKEEDIDEELLGWIDEAYQFAMTK